MGPCWSLMKELPDYLGLVWNGLWLRECASQTLCCCDLNTWWNYTHREKNSSFHSHFLRVWPSWWQGVVQQNCSTQGNQASNMEVPGQAYLQQSGSHDPLLQLCLPSHCSLLPNAAVCVMGVWYSPGQSSHDLNMSRTHYWCQQRCALLISWTFLSPVLNWESRWIITALLWGKGPERSYSYVGRLQTLHDRNPRRTREGGDTSYGFGVRWKQFDKMVVNGEPRWNLVE